MKDICMEQKEWQNRRSNEPRSEGRRKIQELETKSPFLRVSIFEGSQLCKFPFVKVSIFGVSKLSLVA